MTDNVEMRYMFEAGQAVGKIINLSKMFFGLADSEEKAQKKSKILSQSLNTIKPPSFMFKAGELTGKMINFTKSFFNLGENQKKTDKDSKNLHETLKAIKTTALDIAKGFILAQLATSLYHKAMQNMPAVQDMISNIGTVIMRNLFYPLTQAVIPVLNELMAWIKNHRVEFVKLGSVIANVFRAAVGIIKNVYHTIVNIADAIFGNIFGHGRNMIDGLVNFANSVVLKISFIFTFASVYLSKLFSDSHKGLRLLTEAFALFWLVFNNGMKANPFMRLLSITLLLIDSIGTLKKSWVELVNLFNKTKFGGIFNRLIQAPSAAMMSEKILNSPSLKEASKKEIIVPPKKEPEPQTLQTNMKTINSSQSQTIHQNITINAPGGNPQKIAAELQKHIPQQNQSYRANYYTGELGRGK